MKSWCPSSPACASGADFCLGLGVLACKANVGRARRRGSQTSRLRTFANYRNLAAFLRSVVFIV
jgi:hypothetical protein